MDGTPFVLAPERQRSSGEARVLPRDRIDRPEFFDHSGEVAILDWGIEVSNDPMKIPGHSGPRPTY